MESLLLVDQLTDLPLPDRNMSLVDVSAIVQSLDSIGRQQYSIELLVGTNSALLSLYEEFDVPDDLQVAYAKAFPTSNIGLYNHYGNLLQRGDESVAGFVSTLKGKLTEIRLEALLEQEYPGYKFELAHDPFQPIWDLKGISSDGSTDIYVQAKMQGVGSAGEIYSRMQDNPNVLFALSEEVHDKIIHLHPESVEQILSIGVTNLEMTSEVHHDLCLLADNHGIDIPDSIGEVLPYVSEVLIGLRLIINIVSVEKDYQYANLDDRVRIHGVKVLILLSRFGIASVVTATGAIAGSHIPLPGWGTAIGSLGGALTAVYLNRRLKPRVLDIAMNLLSVTHDDMFYFRNKPLIDKVGLSLASTTVR